MVMGDRWRMSPDLRRTSAVVAIVALAIGGAKVASDHTMPGSGFSTVATVAADPTGPPGPTGGMTDGGGSQFQPPQMPSSMPDYQGGINQPPLDQNSGISIYNSVNPQAPQQVLGQQVGQQPQQAQQPAHGTQIPDYQTATPYTQGPGKANPDYQAPQQQSPQQGQQSQQGQQQQQPSQNQQEQQQNERKDDDLQQKCDQVSQIFGYGETAAEMIGGGVGSLTDGPGRTRWSQDPQGGGGDCNCANDQPVQQQSKSKNKNPNYQPCEGTLNNPFPLCQLNMWNTKNCTPSEVAWTQFWDIGAGAVEIITGVTGSPKTIFESLFKGKLKEAWRGAPIIAIWTGSKSFKTGLDKVNKCIG